MASKYGHRELDAALFRHGLSTAGGTELITDWPHIIAAVASSWCDHITAAAATVVISAGPLRAHSALLADGPALAAHAVTAVHAITEIIRANDGARRGKYDDPAANLRIRVDFNHATADVVGVHPAIPGTAAIATATIYTPAWIDAAYWPSLGSEDKQAITTVDHPRMLAAVRRAWTELPQRQPIGDEREQGVTVIADDWWICLCGSTPRLAGFHACTADGTVIDPSEPEWDSHLHVCADCGRIIHAPSGRIVGGRTTAPATT